MPSTHQALVERILADARPVRPLWPPTVRLALWLVLEAGAIAVAARIGLRHDLAAQLVRPAFLAQLVAIGAAAACAAALALWSTVPGRAPAPRVVRLAALLGGAAVLLALFEPLDGRARTLAVCLRCAGSVLAFGLLPCAILLVALQRGAPLDAFAAAAYASSAAFLLAVAAVRVACPIDDRLHLLAWHVLPGALAAAAVTILASRRLDRLARVSSLRGAASPTVRDGADRRGPAA